MKYKSSLISFLSIFIAFLSLVLSLFIYFSPEPDENPTDSLDQSSISSQDNESEIQVHKTGQLSSISGDLVQTYEVTEVVDGDTIKVVYDGEEQSVRLIGIDTPELEQRGKESECYSVEAKNYLDELLLDRKVILEFDISQGIRDRYGRLLAYTFDVSGNNLGEILIQRGYASEYTYGSAYKYQTEFIMAEDLAQKNMLGMWNPANCNNSATKTPTPQKTKPVEITSTPTPTQYIRPTR